MVGMYSTSHLDDGIEWFTGNTRGASSDRARAASVVALFLMALLSFDTAGE